MIRKWYIVIVLFCCLACIGASPLEALRQAEELKLSADEIVATQNGAGDIVAQGNVRLEYGILTVTAEKVSLNRETLDFAANGNVVAELSDGTGRWEAPAISGNMKTHEMKFGPYRADGEIWHIGGEDAAYDAEGIANVQRGWVTTCDKKEPHYRLQSKQITIKPDKTFTAKHVTLHVGNVPIFYFPYLWGDFQGMDNIIFKPGYSGKRGFYLRLGRIWRTAKHTENGDGQISLYGDLMTKRGIGLGSDAAYESRDKQRQASSTLYYLHDWDTPETAHGWNRRFKSTDDRFRIHGYFRETWDGDWGPFERATFRANLDYLSDIDMLEDWFRRIHRRQQQPRSFLDFALEGEVVSAGIDLRPRINDFYTVAQTLPELRLDVARTELFPQLPLQYQSSTRAGYYSMKWRDFDRSRKDLLPDDIWYDSELYRDNSDYEAFRAHTQHFLYVPTELSDWSILTPRAGFALTYYNRSSKQPITQKDIADMIDLDNPEKTRSKTIVKEYDSKGGDVTRFAFETGAEWRGAFYSDWFDCKNEILQLTSIRHVVEPYLNYTYMHNPSHDRDHLYYFDDIDRLENSTSSDSVWTSASLPGRTTPAALSCAGKPISTCTPAATPRIDDAPATSEIVSTSRCGMT